MISQLTLLYCRFIDDIFFIWTGNEAELLGVTTEMNKIHPTIKFDVQYSKESINFLDTTVSITKENTIKTTIYKKPTDRKAYLHAKSYHPRRTKEAIAYSQSLRIRRICSDRIDYQSESEQLLKELVERGHEEKCTKSRIDKAKGLDRLELLQYKDKTRNSRIPLVITYNRNLPKLHEVIDNTWKTLGINSEEAIKFEEKPLLAFRRNRNLKNLLGQNRISNGKVVKKTDKKIGKCTPCLSRIDTKCCKHIQTTSTFKNQAKTKVYDIFHNVNCKTQNAIYLAECRKCNDKPYVGKVEDQRVHKRINKHRNDSKNPNSIPVDRHFLLPGHNFERDFKLTVIEAVVKPNLTKERMRDLLKRREDFWIMKLGTLQPNGFNEDLNFAHT